MKSNTTLMYGPILFLLVVVCSMAFTKVYQSSNEINGAWQMQNQDNEAVLLFANGYFTHTSYNKPAGKFMQSNGGPFDLKSNVLTITKEFDTQETGGIGKAKSYTITFNANQLIMEADGNKTNWKRIDDTSADLAGTWKITGRKQDGTLTQIHQTGPRKTLKILTGTRFQWAAINPATKEFFGTGGGNYIFNNGKYTENIEFFSRDSSRVGASLSFDGKVENGDWHHSGKSSRGEDIYEVWSRINKK